MDPAAASSEDPHVRNEFDRTSGRFNIAGPEYTVTYEFEPTQSKTRIFANAPYFERIRAGKVVSGTRFWWSPFQWQFPKLSIKMNNDTEKRILVTQAAIDVRSSEINTDPVLIVEENEYKVGYFSVLNEGWGPVLSPKLQMHIGPTGAYGFFPHDGPWFHQHIEEFEEKADIKIGGVVPSELVAEKQIAVFGILRYRTVSNVEKVLSFQNRVWLVRPGPGMPAPPSYSYDLFLEAGKAGYTKHLALAQEIGSGESDHFLIRVGTDKSAVFDLTYSFKTSDGQVLPSKNILLDVFVPRSDSERRAESKPEFYGP